LRFGLKTASGSSKTFKKSFIKNASQFPLTKDTLPLSASAPIRLNTTGGILTLWLTKLRGTTHARNKFRGIPNVRFSQPVACKANVGYLLPNPIFHSQEYTRYCGRYQEDHLGITKIRRRLHPRIEQGVKSELCEALPSIK
jgi:hypothetical protein